MLRIAKILRTQVDMVYRQKSYAHGWVWCIGKNPAHTGGYGVSAKILHTQVDMVYRQKSCTHRWI